MIHLTVREYWIKTSILWLYLPPANEVWSKAMFLHLSVSHSVHRRVFGEGVVVRGCRRHPTPRGRQPSCTQRQTPPAPAPEADTPLDPEGQWSTHPTGLHSCFGVYVTQLWWSFGLVFFDHGFLMQQECLSVMLYVISDAVTVYFVGFFQTKKFEGH